MRSKSRQLYTSIFSFQKPKPNSACSPINTMETPNSPDNWSTLPVDIVRSMFERLSFVDFHRAKMVCSDWYSFSKQTIPRKVGSPWLTLFPEDGGCVLYNPDEDKVYRTRTEKDFSSGTQFLASSGKWFLVLDSISTLYIVDVISGTRIDLPPLDSVLLSDSTLKRVGDREFRWEFVDEGCFVTLLSDHLRGRLWVDEKGTEFSVAWFFSSPACFLFSCKKGSEHHTVIPLRDNVPKLLNDMTDLVLLGYRLYILTKRRFVRVLDVSGQQGFKDLTESKPYPMFSPLGEHRNVSLAVTTAGEVLLAESTTFEKHRSFHIHKKDPDADLDFYRPKLLEVHSLGDEALLLDMGITVPANQTLGIKPNCIYFTSHDRICPEITLKLDICVFNLATKTLDRFPALTNMNLKDGQWFLPMTGTT